MFIALYQAMDTPRRLAIMHPGREPRRVCGVLLLESLLLSLQARSWGSRWDTRCSQRSARGFPPRHRSRPARRRSFRASLASLHSRWPEV
jgi:hypothetical protein